MDALRASYGDSSSKSVSDTPPAASTPTQHLYTSPVVVDTPLPPPPLSLLNPPNTLDCLQTGQPTRVRSFPHVEANYALHVFIPVHISLPKRKELVPFLKRVSSHIPGLHVVNVDIPLDILRDDDQRFEQVVLDREFHISLGRTVPIRVHQIESVVTMLRQKLQGQKRYWIDFNKWEVFVNDDHTRTFIAMEVTTGGLAEITRSIQAVNDVYKLHNLPEFYKDPRPHISLVWALGDISHVMQRVIGEELKTPNQLGGPSQKQIFAVKFGAIDCKIGKKLYKICKVAEA